MTDPIITEAEYTAAIAEIRRLWGAADGTEDGNRLDTLLPLVLDYEHETEKWSQSSGCIWFDLGRPCRKMELHGRQCRVCDERL